MRGRPVSPLSRFAVARQKEISTRPLEALRRAGADVFDVRLVADERRAQLAAAGLHPWDADAPTASLLLSAWIAQVHQTLGAELLDSDRREDPRTAGFVPTVTYRQAWAFFEPVPLWLTAARRAEASPDFWVGDEVELPVSLGGLLLSGEMPRKHLKGMLNVGDALDGLLEEQLGAVHAAGPPPERYGAALRRIDELAAQARSALHYAQGLWHPEVDAELQSLILGHLHPALVLEHHLGQYLALPELVSQYRSVHRRRVPARRARRSAS